MPHQCTNCGHVFPNGSKEMLSGCPDCGGNKFQFHPDGVPTDALPEEKPPDRPSEGSSTVANAVGRATTTLRDFIRDDADHPQGTAGPGPAAETPASGGVPTATDDPVERPAPDDDAPVSGGEPAPGQEPASDREPPSDPVPTSDREPTSDPEPASGRGPDAGASPEDAPTLDEWSDADEEPPGADDPADGVRADDGPDGRADDGPDGRADDGPDGRADDGLDGQAGDGPGDQEDSAQADARSSMVDAGDLPAGDRPAAPDDARVVEPRGDSRPDVAELREELNDQFEGIRVVAPGQYELNLMELYDREEVIIAIQENGRYVIEVPETHGLEES